MAHDHSVTGYVSNDPKRIQTKDGRDLAVFSIAENKRFYDRDAGQWADAKPTYYDVAVERESLRENVLAGLQKGQRVNVEGKYSPRAYIDREGAAQVGHQMWAEDVSASMSRPVKELKNFQKLMLKPGESRTLTFRISEEDLKFYNGQLQRVAEPGEFNVQVGLDSQAVQQQSFELL